MPHSPLFADFNYSEYDSLERRLELYDPLPASNIAQLAPDGTHSNHNNGQSVPTLASPSDELWQARKGFHDVSHD